ncbi:DivIVA domain-containing protein [Spongisporangium articulatum]|uniref:DivIVA domain-containing protein n=1 Tax=Spongisporangium articulatum TaxID=3362603 RepID=A0ABW8AQ94_9ACTN
MPNLLLLLLTLGVVAAVVALATGFLSGGSLEEVPGTVPERALPPRPLTGQDVEAVRFVPALRGYRMDQVDAAMDRLGAEIDGLRARLQAAGLDPDDGAPGAPVAAGRVLPAVPPGPDVDLDAGGGPDAGA